MKPHQEKLYLEETTVRLVAAQVVFSTSLILFTESGWIAILLAVDFALRAFTPLPSPLALLARFVMRQLAVKPVQVFAPPKKFAAGIGFLFALGLTVLLYLEFMLAAEMLGGVLIFFALLESVFRICVGCYVYDVLVAPWLNRK